MPHTMQGRSGGEGRKESVNVGIFVCWGVHESEQAGSNNCSLLCSTEFSLSAPCQALVPQLSALTCRWEDGLGTAAYQSLPHRQTAFHLQI